MNEFDIFNIIEKRQYLWNEKRYSIKENAILIFFQSLSDTRSYFSFHTQLNFQNELQSRAVTNTVS